MEYLRNVVLILVFAVVSAADTVKDKGPSRPAYLPGAVWETLEPGLELGTFHSPQASETGDSLIRILRINPQRFEFRLLNASNPEYGLPLTAKMWCRRNGLVAAINASMYQTDHRTSVSLMQTKVHTNNSRLTKDMAILAFDRKSPEVPLVKIIDRQCETFDNWKDKYGTFIQSIRMVSCKKKNVWNQQPGKWSTAAIGTDNQGRVLFIHVRTPFSTHDLITILMDLPLDLSRTMYAEGGPEAQLFVQSGNQVYEFIGGDYAWPIPNIVGITRRDRPLE